MESLPKTNKIIKAEKGQVEVIEIPLEQPLPNQVLVKIEYAPINALDLMKINGYYYGPENADPLLQGFEASGTIAAVGDYLKSTHKVGDRVHVYSPGAYRQYFATTKENVYPILHPDLSFEIAASHFVNPSTVYYMGDVAVKAGHKAAIQTAASSALGKMLIRYFKQKGIKLINVVRNEEYIEELKKEGADYVLNSSAPDFEAKLKELAEKENARLAFDAVAGDFTNKILTCMPPNSTCHVYGALSGHVINGISVMELFKGKVLKSLLVTDFIGALTAEQYAQFVKEVHTLLPTIFKSTIQKKFKVDDAKEAVEEFHKGTGSKGKILIQFH